MLRFRLFGFPVAVQPLFFLTAWLIGPPARQFQALIVWIACVFVGVLAHELGHAFAGRHFRLDPAITLHGFGGLTSWQANRSLGNGQRILLSAAGPAVGITVGVAVYLVSRLGHGEPGSVGNLIFQYMLWVNLGWGILNLAPVLPLDGGHIAASAAEAAFGRRGRTVALAVSLVATGSLALWAIWRGEIWMTILAVILAVSNFQGLAGTGSGPRRDRPVTGPAADAVRSYDLARGLAQAGQDDEALEWLAVALKTGFSNAAIIDADPAWAALRHDPRFVELRRSLAPRSDGARP